MDVRKPAVAGQFYESDAGKLQSQIVSCFTSKFGPGSLPSNKKSSKKVLGFISPHAGYFFSGPAAAFSYKAVAESSFPSTFIIVGPNHSGVGSDFSTTTADWETPLGRVKVDKDFVAELTSRCDFVEEDYSPHLHEHSVEVQLPFLQFVFRDNITDLKFVPIVIGSHNVSLLKNLGETIASIDKNVCIIASSDFTHYGRSYEYLPFKDNVKERMYKLDENAIDLITSFKSSGLISYVNKTHVTICGFAPILVAMSAVKKLGGTKGKLLKYYTSGDVVNDYSNSVGYASIIFV